MSHIGGFVFVTPPSKCFSLLYVSASGPLHTVNKDGQYQTLSHVRPEHISNPLVVGCSKGTPLFWVGTGGTCHFTS